VYLCACNVCAHMCVHITHVCVMHVRIMHVRVMHVHVMCLHVIHIVKMLLCRNEYGS
jgi:hypothetical protein